jgi:hypothetical protein
MERGGPTTQSGIIYQNSIAAIQLGKLVDPRSFKDGERVVRVRVEALTKVDDIVIEYADKHKLYIQVKENVSPGGKAWVKMWTDFCEQYCDQSFKKGFDLLLLQNGEPSKSIENVRKLCLYAKESTDYKEWVGRLTKEQKTLVDSIYPHIAHLLVDKEQIKMFYAHIMVKTDTIEYIESEVSLNLPECNSDPRTLFKILRDRAGEKSRVRGIFTAAELVRILEAEDNIIFKRQMDIVDLQAVIKSCNGLLRQTKRTIGRTKININRTVVGDIMNWIQLIPKDNNVAVLLDQAGMGKSAVMGELVENLEVKKVPVLAIKADLQLSGLKNYDDISERLGLPETIDRIVGRLASQGIFVLIIDQVDALSLAMAHDQTSINLILEMIARLRGIPGVNILLSCRTFDYYNDPRIKSVELGERFELNPFSDDEVRTVLDKVKIQYNLLTPSTQKLLAIPLHLHLFVMAIENGDEKSVTRNVDIASLHQLYQMIWDTFIISTNMDGPPAYERIEVVKLMAEHMNKRQTISVKKSLFTEYDKYRLQNAVHWLASSGLIVNGKNEWTFFHQTFFDYSYARKLIEEGFSLSSWLQESDQGLFCRPQVIQILAYLREGGEEKEYISALAFVFQSENIRFHIKDHVRKWFGFIRNPTEQECLLAQRMLQNKNHDYLLISMFGNEDWFYSLRTTVVRLVENDVDDEGIIIPYLNSLLETDVQGDIIDILTKNLGKSEKWNIKIGNMLNRIENWRSNKAVELVEKLILTESGFNLAHFFGFKELCEFDPIAGCRIVRVVLEQMLEQQLSEKSMIFSIHRSIDNLSIRDSGKVFTKLAELAPETYLNNILPWIEKVMLISRGKLGGNNKFQHDALSDFWYEDIYHNFVVFIESIESALCNLKYKNSEQFLLYIQRLTDLPYATSQQLVARIYTKFSKDYTSSVFNFLIGDKRRFNLGTEQYESCQLVKSCVPYLKKEELIMLEYSITEYLPVYKNFGIEGLELTGLEQLRLLHSFPRELLSSKGLRRLMEWERKFQGWVASEDPRRIHGGIVVDSPIGREGIQKMSDLDWLNAFKKYKGKKTHKDLAKGGAFQLASFLQEFTIDNPQRFYKLALSTPIDVDESYIRAFCEGLALSDGPTHWLSEVCLHFAKHLSNESKIYISWSLDKRVEMGLPEEINLMLEGFYRNTFINEGNIYDDVDSGSINTVRAVVFSTLFRSLASSETDTSIFRRWEILQYSVTDKCIYVRAAAVEKLKYMLQYDRDRCIIIFKRLMDGYPRLLEAHSTFEFCRYGIFSHFGLIWPYINDMLYHQKETCRENGSRLACIAAISSNLEVSSTHPKLLGKLVEGKVEWRKGAADVLSHNFTSIRSNEIVNSLIILADDESGDVRASVARIFYELKDEPVNTEYLQFILRFVSTKSVIKGFYPLAEYLWLNGIFYPQWSMEVIENFLENKHEDQERQWLYGAEKLIRLILRINIDPLSSTLDKNKSMDLFDKLMKQFVNDATKVLNEWDRR